MTSKKPEVSPLLPSDLLGGPSYKKNPLAISIRKTDQEEDSEFEVEDDDEVFDHIEQKKKRNVSLLWEDLAILAIEYIQILALTQSMSLRWVWPENWLRSTYFLFLFNLDVWEFVKFVNPDTYLSVQDNYIDSSNVDIKYDSIVIGWYSTFGVFCLVYAVIYLVTRYRFYPVLRACHVIAWLQRISFNLVQVLTLPLGIVIFRMFHCNDSPSPKVDVMNQFICFRADHWAYLGPGLFIAVFLFIFYPVYLLWKIRAESMSGTEVGNTAFILLKETEYKLHLNWSWLHHGMYIFTSFRYWGLYYRVMMHLVKLILLIIFASSFQKIQTQAIVVTVYFFVIFVAFIIIRPFRMKSFNYFLAFGFLCLTANGFTGALRASYNSYTLASTWLLPEYLIWFLVLVQLAWFLFLVFMIVFLLGRTLCHRQQVLCKRSVWPNIASSGIGLISTETRKFMMAIIKARIALDRIQRMPKMFAPVHELSRHIQIVNAYCREAEYLGDALHSTLWEVLDELIETHADIEPHSLFAETVKDSIRHTAREFLQLMPAFTRRLAQRDYDFLLVHPKRKRILLKIYVMGIFLNGRAEKLAKKRLLNPGLQKVWPPPPEDKEFEDEDNYFEDLYPGPIDLTLSTDIRFAVPESSDGEDYTDEEDVSEMLQNLPAVKEIRAPSTLSLQSEGKKSRPGSAVSRHSQPFGNVMPSGQKSSVFAPVRPTSASSSASSSLYARLTGQPLRPGSGRPSSASSRGSKPGQGSLVSLPGRNGHESGQGSLVSLPREGRVESEQGSQASLPGQIDDAGEDNPGFVADDNMPKGGTQGMTAFMVEEKRTKGADPDTTDKDSSDEKQEAPVRPPRRKKSKDSTKKKKKTKKPKSGKGSKINLGKAAGSEDV